MEEVKMGTLIKGTYRLYPLITAFEEELVRLRGKPLGWKPATPEKESDPWWESKTACVYRYQLEWELNSFAPDGCYFGAHKEDGGNYGFWALEEAENGEVPDFH